MQPGFNFGFELGLGLRGARRLDFAIAAAAKLERLVERMFDQGLRFLVDLG